MTYHLSDEQEKYFYDTLEELCRQSRLLESHRYMQHGDTSVFRTVCRLHISAIIWH